MRAAGSDTTVDADNDNQRGFASDRRGVSIDIAIEIAIEIEIGIEIGIGIGIGWCSVRSRYRFR
jgi:hypothetical protein